MIIRALDQFGDWTLGAGKSNFLSGLSACAMDIETRIKEFLNDCFFQVDAGIDWLNLIGSKDIVGINNALVAVISATQNVTGVVKVESSLKDRNLFIEYTVTTVFTGDINNGVLNRSLTFLATELGLILTNESGDEIGA